MLELWRNKQGRQIIYQVLTVLGFLLTALFLFKNVQYNLEKQNIASGFGFLNLEAGFAIGEKFIDYNPSETYLKAMLVGAANTLKVAVIGNILAILIGIIVGILALSKSKIISAAMSGFIGTIRNIPLLLQLFFWYSLFTDLLPSVKQAYNPIPGVFLSNRGLVIPALSESANYSGVMIGLLLAFFCTGIIFFYGKKHKLATGKTVPVFPITLGLIILFPLLGWLFTGMPTALEIPQLQGFNFNGGMTLTPEFSALLLGLCLYTGAFNAEIVRAGINSVGQGQWEAARALGLGEISIMRLVILPQALRVIIPPLTSQILNLTKNSSLAVAIAYPDFVAVVNTSMNQTGQAVEMVALIMAFYLTLSLLSSAFMNWYNKKTNWGSR